MLSFTEIAKSKVHYFLQNANQPSMVLRIAESAKEQSPYHFSLEPQEAGSDKDLTMPMDGFYVRMDSYTAVQLAMATVDWQTKEDKEGFTVIKPKVLEDENLESLPLKDQIVHALKTIYDPEIPVNIFDMGLIYNIDLSDPKNITIQMTLTAPNCPAAEVLPQEVQNKVQALKNVENVTINLTWEPAWNPNMMTEAAKLEMGM